MVAHPHEDHENHHLLEIERQGANGRERLAAVEDSVLARPMTEASRHAIRRAGLLALVDADAVVEGMAHDGEEPRLRPCPGEIAFQIREHPQKGLLHEIVDIVGLALEAPRERPERFHHPDDFLGCLHFPLQRVVTRRRHFPARIGIITCFTKKVRARNIPDLTLGSPPIGDFPPQRRVETALGEQASRRPVSFKLTDTGRFRESL